MTLSAAEQESAELPASVIRPTISMPSSARHAIEAIGPGEVLSSGISENLHATLDLPAQASVSSLQAVTSRVAMLLQQRERHTMTLSST
jgi:hypothetical protein